MNVYNFLALIALCANAVKKSGRMTMWTKNHDVITGSMCGYAAPVIGGLASPAITNSHYFPTRFLCAANQSRHPFSCGKCFRVTYTSGGSEPGRQRPGSAEIQIVDAMAADKDFDCLLNPFQKITGTDTGVFPITYEEIPCTLTDNGYSKLTVMDWGNSWNTKVIVSNAKTSVSSVQMTVPGKSFMLQRSGNSATWIDGPQLRGETGAASFVVKLSNGETLNFNPCFNNWPVKFADSCLTPAAGGGQPTHPPTRRPTPLPTARPTRSPTAVVSTAEPTSTTTAAAVVVSTAKPTPAPTAQQGGAAAKWKCFINQCGCPGSKKFVATTWCRETSVNGVWCAKNKNNCDQCSGVWCKVVGRAGETSQSQAMSIHADSHITVEDFVVYAFALVGLVAVVAGGVRYVNREQSGDQVQFSEI